MTSRRKDADQTDQCRRLLCTALFGSAIAGAPVGLFSGAAQAASGPGGPVVIFAAASLHDLLNQMLAQWRTESGHQAVVSYAGTSALARQIERGAPADLFISADQQWMDYLVGLNLVQSDAVVKLAANSLVLIVPVGSEPAVPDRIVDSRLSLLSRLGSRGRLAMANPQHVPAGRYGMQALQSLGLFDAVRTRLTRSANVRLALTLVARGECPLGVVYASDAHAEDGVQVLASFPAGSHEAISYPAATIGDTPRPEATELLAWLAAADRAGALIRHGFLQP